MKQAIEPLGFAGRGPAYRGPGLAGDAAGEVVLPGLVERLERSDKQSNDRAEARGLARRIGFGRCVSVFHCERASGIMR